ncbi:MAG: tetratricopeptide repeat protein, partial [Sphingomonadales bacterium]
SFQFKGQNLDIQLIGKQLGVATVLEGSVRKSGTRLRITAQLIDAEQGFHIWSETYDRELTDIFAIQDEISKAIVDALKVSLDLGGNEKLLDAGTDNLEAYNAFLRGRYLFHRRGAGLLQAGKRFEEAIAFDDQYANAYANLALTFSVGWGIRDVTKARSAAARAVELDPESSLAWTAQAMVLEQFDWDFNGSMAAYEKALELDPNNADAYHALALMHFDFGRAGKAIELEKKAIERDPAAFIFRLWLGLMYRAQGDFEKALDELRVVTELRPGFAGGHAVSALVLLHLGRTEEAEAATTEAERVAPSPYNALSIKSGFLFASGHKEQAAKLARQALALPEAGQLPVFKIANALITGDAELSNRLIEEAFRLRHGFVTTYRHPMNDIAHDTLAKTRFWELMREHGLMVDEDE